MERRIEITDPEEAQRHLFTLFREREIPINSKWDETLELLQNDERFLMVPNIKDRKHIFKKYIEIERTNYKKSISDLKLEQRNNFKKMLEEDQRITVETKFCALTPIFYQDPRWMCMDEKEREEAYLEYMEDLFRKEANNEKRMIAEQCERLKKQMLEMSKINSSTLWSEVQEYMRFNPLWNELHNYYKLK